MNKFGMIKIIEVELSRAKDSWIQGIVGPLLTYALFFFIFGSVLGSRIQNIEGVQYELFVTPGILILFLLTYSVSRGAIGIFTSIANGRIVELITAPLSHAEIVIPFIIATALRTLLMLIALIMISKIVIDFEIHNFIGFLAYSFIAVFAFSTLGVLIGLMASDIDTLQSVPIIIVSPLVYLGGSFYSIDMLPEYLKVICLANPFYYLVNGARAFFTGADPGAIFASFLALTFLMTISAAGLFFAMKKDDRFY